VAKSSEFRGCLFSTRKVNRAKILASLKYILPSLSGQCLPIFRRQKKANQSLQTKLENFFKSKITTRSPNSGWPGQPIPRGPWRLYEALNLLLSSTF